MKLKEKYNNLSDKNKRLVKLTGIVVFVAMVFYAKFVNNLNENKYLDFTKSYFEKIKTANVDMITSKTSNVLLYQKIGTFNTNICLSILGKEVTYGMMAEYQHLLTLKDELPEEKQIEEISNRMYKGCKSRGAYVNYKNYFNKIQMTRTSIDEYGDTRLTINVYSKMLSKNIEMVAVIKELDGELYMEEIEFFPSYEVFLNRRTQKEPEIDVDAIINS